jgi:cardiolipin synthase
VRTVASALRGLANPGAAPNANTLADTPAARAAVGRVIAAWGQVQASGDEVAGMLLGASEARLRVERELSVELVWTGPTTRFVPTRRTEQVLLDLIASATKDLFLVSFVAYNVPSVVAALNDAASRGVRLRILFEASTSHGGTLNYDPAATMRSRVPTWRRLFTWKEKPSPSSTARSTRRSQWSTARARSSRARTSRVTLSRRTWRPACSSTVAPSRRR